MVQSLTFIDCRSCGKRIRSNAPKCHHCDQDNLLGNPHDNPLDANNWVKPGTLKKTVSTAGKPNDDSHMALEHGGYDDADDFDYDEYLAQEFPDKTALISRRKRWVWITAWVLIFATLLPYLYYAVILAS